MHLHVLSIPATHHREVENADLRFVVPSITLSLQSEAERKGLISALKIIEVLE